MKIEKVAYLQGFRCLNDGQVIGKSGSVMKGRLNTSGYRFFSFRNGIKVFHISFHRMQAYQKYGDGIYGDGIVVRHFDGDKLNNSWDNILIGTSKDNAMDIPEHIRISRAIYASSFNKKHDHERVISMRKEGASYDMIMKELGITSKGTISFIINKSQNSKA